MASREDSGPLENTGERYHPEVHGEIRQEHMHRYGWASTLVIGRDVLDIASGEGFGSALLAARAKSVVGVDSSHEAIEHARKRYEAFNLRFLQADATATSLADQSFDAIVSFETIEHLVDHEGMFAEIERLLRPNGYIVISSPNPDIYSVRQENHNPFHVKELDRLDFTQLLNLHFPAYKMFGQRLAVASFILGPSTSSTSPSLMRDSGEISEDSSELPDTMYFVAVAAREEKYLPAVSASVLVTDFYDVYWEMRAKLKETQREVVALRGRSFSELAAEQGLFEEAYYRFVSLQRDLPLPALFEHYLTVGENADLAPSVQFDPMYYRQQNPDVVRSGIGLLRHYILFGADEGRRPKAPTA